MNQNHITLPVPPRPDLQGLSPEQMPPGWPPAWYGWPPPWYGVGPAQAPAPSVPAEPPGGVRKLAYSVEEAAEALGVSRSLMYQLIHQRGSVACPFCGRMAIVKELGRTGGRDNLSRWRRAVVLRWYRGALWARAYDCGKHYKDERSLTGYPDYHLIGVYRFKPGLAEASTRYFWDYPFQSIQSQNGPLKDGHWNIPNPYHAIREGTSALDGMVTKVVSLVGAYMSVSAIKGFATSSMEAANTQINAQRQLRTVLNNMGAEESFNALVDETSGNALENTLTLDTAGAMSGYDSLADMAGKAELGNTLRLATAGAVRDYTKLTNGVDGVRLDNTLDLDTTGAVDSYQTLADMADGAKFENTLTLDTAEAMTGYTGMTGIADGAELGNTLALDTSGAQTDYNAFAAGVDGSAVTLSVQADATQATSAYDAILAKASEIQSRGIYGDEAMIAGAAEFATYFSDANAILSMMDTLTDYAMGMSGGGALDSTAMVDYATGLGKIMSGSYDAMTKKGFEFTDTQKAIIEGTATEAQIVAELGQEYLGMSQDMQAAAAINAVISEGWGGLYETMSNTPEGKLIQLNNTLGDIKENVGAGIYPAVVRFVDMIQSHTPQIEAAAMGLATMRDCVSSRKCSSKPGRFNAYWTDTTTSPAPAHSPPLAGKPGGGARMTIDQLRIRKQELQARLKYELELQSRGERTELDLFIAREELNDVNEHLRALTIGIRKPARHSDAASYTKDRQQYLNWRREDTALDDEIDDYHARMRRAAVKGLDKLRPRQREMLELFLSGRNVTAIAADLGVNKSTVCRNLARAKRRLREETERAMDEDRLLGDSLTVDLREPAVARMVLLALTPMQAVYFYLRYSEGLPMSEIAALTGTNRSTVSRTVRRALQHVDVLLGGQEAVLEHPEALGELAYQAYCRLVGHPELSLPSPPERKWLRTPIRSISVQVRQRERGGRGKLLSSLLERQAMEDYPQIHRWLEAVFTALLNGLQKRGEPSPIPR